MKNSEVIHKISMAVLTIKDIKNSLLCSVGKRAHSGLAIVATLTKRDPKAGQKYKSVENVSINK